MTMTDSTPQPTIASEAGIVIRSVHDIAQAAVACCHSAGLVAVADDLPPEFFDLRSGFAGELFQKFTNYGIPLAIVVTDPAAHGERFRELACEHASHRHVRIVQSVDAGSAWLAGQHGEVRFDR
jgi:hypothetical protein